MESQTRKISVTVQNGEVMMRLKFGPNYRSLKLASCHEILRGGRRRDLNPAFAQASNDNAFQAPQAYTALFEASVRYQIP